jgi:3-methyladenine DNA glycosylase AlkC
MNTNYLSLKYLTLLILAEYLLKYPQSLSQAINLIEIAATHEEWSVRETAIRETAIYAIISCLKMKSDIIFPYLNQLTKRSDHNLRRLVSESLRPSSSIKWLRDPQRNDKVLSILSKLKTDQSIYVRKSVGNNLKDLSKYMPGKILDLVENWVRVAKIQVKDDLASEKGLNKEEKKLIWTIKHAMRWIQKKNPEYHNRLEAILGKNYILYFDEKSNKLAKPS